MPTEREACSETVGYGGATSYQLAGYHGVQPLLYLHLREMSEELLSTEHMVQLRGVVGARSAHSLVLVHELGRLSGLFEVAGIPFIALKGPVLAQTVFGGVAHRPFVDLDLVIRDGDFGRVEALLGAEGYRSSALAPFQKSSYLYIHGQYTFWRRIHQMGSAASVLDVHTAVMPPGYSYDESFDDLYARSGTVPMAGTATHTLAREDLLLVLCFHGFKNRWDRLKYVCDVAELLRSYPEMDWDAVYDRAGAMHSRRVLRLGLAMAAGILEAPLPEEVRRDVRRDRRVAALWEALRDRLPEQAHMRVEPYMDRVRLNTLAQDTIVGQLRYGAYAAARRLTELYLPESE